MIKRIGQLEFRATSKVRQWALWLCAALAALAVYVVVSRLAFGSVSWAVFEPHRQRLVLPLVLLFWLFAWETRWDGMRRERETGDGEPGEGKGPEKVEEVVAPPPAAQPVDAEVRRVRKDVPASSLPRQAAASTEESASPPSDGATGEELFAQARGRKHREIPDFYHDADYLGLLGASAAKGYAPALAKLGEYAMRRAAWVEAYYWMKQAQRKGMHGLSPTLREIRKNWSLANFPGQSSNVNPLFTLEAGSIGRALLHVDSGHEAAKAREFLKEHYPAYL